LFGLRRRTATARARRSILLIAVACGALMLIVVAWIMPESNQAFRELLIGHRIPRGDNELTLGSLWARADWFHYHQRLALSCATVVLTWFACRVMAARRSVALGLAGVVVYVCAALMLQVSHASLPALLAAWLPNLIMAGITAGLKPSTTPA
jgi:lipopolysaccharide export LptBFGC system permease protein LptF